MSLLAAGFAWLTVAKNGSLAVETTPNQDNPLMKGLGYSGNTPILALDVVSLLPWKDDALQVPLHFLHVLHELPALS